MKYTVLSIAVLALAVGCGQEEDTPREEPSPTAEQQEASQQPEREIRRSASREEPQPLPRRDEVDPEKKIPDIEGAAQEDGYGLTMVVDGSSPQAFQESLELIAMDTTSEQYRQLDSALRFLGTYDQSAWSGLPNLYQSLDGLSGEEIIERARTLRDERRRR